ncbi:histidine kinase [Flagellimonas sp. 389]|uniref:sensor histidine kinase n=1 Tax=Flagellimonas sp. 389 TaxID=2835862 RepID=UPI001BD1CAA6|nr:histidine kinase [Flagellimonas sp. 389]MBS9463482.1 histidine kinase [Flagellimonas sp. 389]
MPKFLLKKRMISYAVILVVGIIITTLFSSYYLNFYFKNINIHLPTSEFFISISGKIAITTEVILSLCLSMTLFLTDEWYRNERSIREIGQKQIETELNLLKNQINPHFLFNSLNSIYIMLGRNLESGKKMLLQFSEILSHQLYETGKKHIALEREFENLKNYIDIERIRHEDLVTVSYEFPDNQEGLTIVPMLLMPIVENAFKHGQSSQGYWVKIEAIIASGQTLNFTVENTVSNSQTENSFREGRGIGLANVKRRLELIYPNRHLFNTECKKGTFTVNLKIQLNENKLFSS